MNPGIESTPNRTMKTNQLKDKVALVTGASRGIGKAISAALLNVGVNTMVTARSAELLQKLQTEYRGLAGSCETIAGDLAEASTPAELVDATTSTVSHKF